MRYHLSLIGLDFMCTQGNHIDVLEQTTFAKFQYSEWPAWTPKRKQCQLDATSTLDDNVRNSNSSNNGEYNNTIGIVSSGMH